MIPYSARAVHPALQFVIFIPIAGLTGFAWQFWLTYHKQVNQGVFYLLVIAVFLISVIAFAGTCLIIFRMYLKGKEMALLNKSRLADLEKSLAEKQIYVATAKQIENNHVFLTEQKTTLGTVKFKQLPKHHAKTGMNSAEVLPELDLSEPELKSSLLADIERDMNILIIAPKQGAGKTTMLGHLATQRLNRGEIVKVFDPHFELNKECWSPRCEFYGKGRNYKEIKQGLDDLLAEMDYRFKHSISQPPITFIMDEMKTVCEKVGAADYFAQFLTEGRKCGIKFIGAGHSTRVKALGLERMGDLFYGFDSILYLSKIDFKIRRAVFDENGNEINSFYHHPGALNYQHSNNNNEIKLNPEFTNRLNEIMQTPIVLSKDEKIEAAYYELFKSGKKPISKNDIALKVYGHKCNGRVSVEIETALKNAGISLN